MAPGFAKSLRLRLVLFAVLVIALALIATGIALSAMFSRHIERRIGQELDTQIAQIAGAVRFSEASELYLARAPADPRFNEVFAGLYWQITDLSSGSVLRSRSLWDASLNLPDSDPQPGTTYVWDITGPTGKSLLAHEYTVVVDHAESAHPIRIAVAIDKSELAQLESGFTRDMVPALVVLGLVLLVSLALQIASGLRPMDRLRRDIASIRAGRQSRLSSAVPAEVSPLVDELNALLEAKHEDMKRARDRAADLAHGLKTPLTALTGDIDALRARGEDDIAARLETTSTQMRRHVERELTRARLRHGDRRAPLDIQRAIDGVATVLRHMPRGKDVAIDVRVEDGLAAPLDPDDVHEIVGNLSENALRHARERLLISASTVENGITISVEDDGPGLAPEQQTRVLQRGVRLDRSGPGAGLGLAIVQDILAEYDGALELDVSELGGLAARVVMPLTNQPDAHSLGD